MSTRSNPRPAADRVSLALALATLMGVAACAGVPTDPERDDSNAVTAASLEPRLDGSDTTDVRRCGHTQGWEC